MLVEEGRPDATGKMKQFASWFTHGVEGGAKLRKAIYEAKNPAQIVDAVEMFFVAPTTGAAEDGIIVESCFEG
jgi:tRNA-dihydrouridine synthase